MLPLLKASSYKISHHTQSKLQTAHGDLWDPAWSGLWLPLHLPSLCSSHTASWLSSRHEYLAPRDLKALPQIHLIALELRASLCKATSSGLPWPRVPKRCLVPIRGRSCALLPSTHSSHISTWPLFPHWKWRRFAVHSHTHGPGRAHVLQDELILLEMELPQLLAPDYLKSQRMEWLNGVCVKD